MRRRKLIHWIGSQHCKEDSFRDSPGVDHRFAVPACRRWPKLSSQIIDVLTSHSFAARELRAGVIKDASCR